MLTIQYFQAIQILVADFATDYLQCSPRPLSRLQRGTSPHSPSSRRLWRLNPRCLQRVKLHTFGISGSTLAVCPLTPFAPPPPWLARLALSGSGIGWANMQVCTSLQADNHASTSLLSFLQAGCPSCSPTNSIKALKAPVITVTNSNNCVVSSVSR